jgi:hypothetical protein
VEPLGPSEHDLELAREAEEACLAAFRQLVRDYARLLSGSDAAVGVVELVGSMPGTVLRVGVAIGGERKTVDFPLWGETYSLKTSAPPASLASLIYTDLEEDVLTGALQRGI